MTVTLEVVEVRIDARALDFQLRHRLLEGVSLAAPLLESLLARLEVPAGALDALLHDADIGRDAIPLRERGRELLLVPLELRAQLAVAVALLEASRLRQLDAPLQLGVGLGEPFALDVGRGDALSQRRLLAAGVCQGRCEVSLSARARTRPTASASWR